ncbi:MAG: hypothetical protein NZX77_17710 [Polyangiaceae bacterium]|nr:hypothetical protein [Polyangiaceae bacterium]
MLFFVLLPLYIFLWVKHPPTWVPRGATAVFAGYTELAVSFAGHMELVTV